MKFFPPPSVSARSAFTLVEIALCLAIIGIALVGIIASLPYGLNTQKDTRQETVINQDVNILLPIITQGARGADDLTNYVYGITNYSTLYKNGVPGNPVTIGYAYAEVNNPIGFPYSSAPLTNGSSIVGVLSLPEFIRATDGAAVPNIYDPNGNNVYSNHIVAYVHSLSGLAAEKPPQNNDLMINDSFSYKLVVVNAPVAMDTNTFDSPYNKQLWQNQREFRLTFYWPLLPTGNTGNEPPLTYRATIAGQLTGNTNNVNNQWLYFYRPQSFMVNTNN